MNKTRKRKWLVEKSDIKKLQQSMNQAKETLHFALNSSRVASDIRSILSYRLLEYQLIRHAGADAISLRANTEALIGCTHSLDPGLCVYSLIRQLYSSLETLLDIWKNILTEVGLPRHAAISATISLRYHKLDDKQTYLVQKVLDLCRDTSEVTTTKVHEAILQYTDLQEALQEHPWAINTIDDAGLSPLVLATNGDQVRSMEVLISAGADVNQQSYHGWTPLMIAVEAENVGSVKLLLMYKSNVNLCNVEGATALHLASKKANPEIISLLLAAGASIKQRDTFGGTPLHSLTKSENTNHQDIEAAIEMLLVAGCSVDISNPISRNLLHLAACYASRGLLHYISDVDLSGIDPYQEDSFGDTPFDDLVEISHATNEWDLRGARRPSLTEQEAFADLCQDVRDQALQNDIQNLERVLGALQDQDIAVAQEYLALLVEKEKLRDRKNLVSWYRAVDKRIQHEEWDLATEDLQDHLLDLQEELATPVWEIPSKYGYLWEFDAGESVSEE
ncbi:ankyrin PH SEC7 domain-containing protein [Fusarium denticulatum]|uniref:Ankyrin PH SEC7 domain-containing protein n=1 Tax=Fusarium denticulatum TaxID=48507 RepID=A0A8H5WJT9_9HYPO|nr:ankyrin PH SEC7 domain-containing protein [Fusarium denticulatum]